jgi:PAS domain S-box-containing protein
MSRRLFSLVSFVPPGFESGAPEKRDLLDGAVALLVASESQAFSLLDGFADRVRGLLVEVGPESGHERMGAALWRLRVTEEVLPHLGELVSSSLDILLAGVEAQEAERRLGIELERARRSLHEAREGFGASSLRLGQIIENLQHEVASRVRAEAALKISEERQRDILNNTSSVIYLKDLDGGYLFVNQVFARLFQTTADQMIGKTDLDLFEADVAESVMANDRQVIRQGHLQEFEEEVPHPDGIHTYISVKFPLMDQDGAPYALCGVSTDITERRRAHAEKVRLEAEYHQAKKVESVGRLAGGVAHDLNNLLSPIIGYADMLLAELPEEDPHRQDLHEILQAGIKARDLVRQLLAFSRRQVLEYRPTDMNQVVAGMERLLRRAIPEDVEITLRLGSEVRAAMADRGQIEQVIMNLAMNAAEAMPEGGRLLLRTSGRTVTKGEDTHAVGPSAGRFAVLTVSDTGTGIDPETMEHLFEPFYSTKGEKGTGLGLATVYGIVKQHGGWISVDSVPGQGTTFEVLLPVADAAPPSREARPTDNGVEGGSETVLLVEDHDQVLRLAKAVLERLGYRVLEARSGGQALEILAAGEGDLDLLLTDVVMPGMSGPELATKAKEIRPGLKVLFMSGYPGDMVSQRGVMEDRQALLSKPFSAEDLAARVRHTLDRT